MKLKKCPFCGYEYKPRSKKPVACPKCKRYFTAKHPLAKILVPAPIVEQKEQSA